MIVWPLGNIMKWPLFVATGGHGPLPAAPLNTTLNLTLNKRSSSQRQNKIPTKLRKQPMSADE